MATLVVLTLWGSSASALAQATDVWTGGVSNGQWSAGGNWGGFSPSSPSGTNPGDNLLFTGNNVTNTNNIMGLVINSISFGSGSGAFTLQGNPVAIGGTSAFTPTPGIINDSTNTQQVGNSTVYILSNQTWNAADGNLVIAGPATPGLYTAFTTASSNTITIVGTNSTSVTMNGQMSDDATDGIKLAIVVSSGKLIVTNANSYSGGTTISGGILQSSSWTVFGDYMVQAGQSDYFGQSVQAGARYGF